MTLRAYHKKRNFKKTNEPIGKVANSSHHLFVIQKHDASHLHYDFRIELNGVLLSWAVPKGPCLDPSVKRLAVHVEDHPIEYGHFEGIIPQGEYGGGTVMLWDKGEWISGDDDPNAAYKKGHLKLILQAEKLKGTWHLIRFKKDDDKSWFLIKGKDKYAKPFREYDITQKKPNSVFSSANLEQIKEMHEEKNDTKITLTLKKSPFPKKIKPQLATLVDKPPQGGNFLHEIKLDGYRMIAYKNGKMIRLLSRRHQDYTQQFKNIVKEIEKLPIKNIIFDGEIVLLDENNKANFQLLQHAIGADAPFKYYIFDLLYYDQYHLMPLALLERKKILKNILAHHLCHDLIYHDHIIGNGIKIFKHACQLGFEGIVSKKCDGPYEEKRTTSWLKIKCTKRQAFVIGGYSPPSGMRQYFGSLYLGHYDTKGRLQFCGNVGTGFSEKSLKTIFNACQKIIVTDCPFTTKPPGFRHAVWTTPKLIAEIEFSEWTKDGLLRQPSFKGLKEDKPAEKVTKEIETEVQSIHDHLRMKLTHPNKILYPELNITKLAVAEYYLSVSEWILPYITDRPITLVRCPLNVKKCFYQKKTNKSTPTNVCSIKIKEKAAIKDYIYIKNQAGLMGLVQMSVLEIHPWGSKVSQLEYPDMITIDLDPAPDVTWKQVVLTAKRIRMHLNEFKLKSFVKSTGGKGLHIVIPILPEYHWAEVKNFTHVFVSFIATQYPNEYVTQMSKSKRGGKIFIDYLRNVRGATAVAAYSTRARENASVAVPLAWDELSNHAKDTTFNIKTVLKRLEKLKKDPWHDFFKLKQSLRLNQIIEI